MSRAATTTATLLAVLACALHARSAGAEDLAFRATPGGLAQLGKVLPSRLPDVVAIDDVARTIVGCPLISSDVVLHVRDGLVEPDVHRLDLAARDGVLVADAVMDFRASGAVSLDACIGTMTCNVTISAMPVRLGLDIGLSTSAAGQIEVRDVDVRLDLHPSEFDLDIAGCALGGPLEWLVDKFEDSLLSWGTSKLEEVAGGLLAERAAGLLAERLPLTIEQNGFVIDAALTRVDASGQTGVTVVGAAGVSWMGLVSPDAPPTEPPSGDPLPRAFGPGDFGLAVADSLVTRALHEAWRGGVFSALLADVAPSIELSGDGLAQKLGLPPGTRLDVRLNLGRSPEARFGRPSDKGVQIALRELDVEVDVDAPGAPPSTLRLAADAALAVGFGIDPVLGALVMEPHDLIVERLEVRAGPSQLVADPARLASFLRDVGTPMLAERLRAMPIAPAMRPFDGAYVWIRNLEAASGWLRAGIDLVIPDPNDRTPPSTRFMNDPRPVPAGMAVIGVTGNDDTTPTPLLRYLAWLDGVPLHEEPTFVPAIRVSAPDGEYLLEVAAVDLNDNVDPAPARQVLVVDGVPPTLEVTRAPDSVVSGAAVAAWRASDERGVVTTRWELRKLGTGDAVGALVDQGIEGAEADVSIGGLDRNALYVLRIIAVDEAGNVTSEEHGFSVERGGCSTAGGGSAPLAILFAVLLLAARRRLAAAALALAAVVAVGAPARAQVVGTNLSGPTDADGAASFWNPAAMARGKGTRLDAGSGLSFIRLGFDADAGGTSSTFVPKPEPTVGAYTDALGDDIRLGFTFGVPQMDGANWARDDGASDVTRYYAVQARNYHLTLTPSVSYRPLRWLAIGGGVRVVHSRMKADLDKDIGKQLNMSIGSPDPDAPFPYADARLAAPVDLEAAGWGVGLVAGVLVEPNDRVAIGLAVHSPSRSRARGRVEVEYPAAMRAFVEDALPAADLPEIAGDFEADLDMPLMVFSAIAVRPAPLWEIRFDHRFLDRSEAANTDLVVVEATSPDVSDTAIVRGYRDRHSVGVRASRLLSGGRLLAAVRARYENNSVPQATATPSNLDFHKVELGAVASYALTRHLLLAGQYSRYVLADRRIDQSLHRPLAEPSLDAYNHPSPHGTFGGSSDQLALMMSAIW